MVIMTEWIFNGQSYFFSFLSLNRIDTFFHFVLFKIGDAVEISKSFHLAIFIISELTVLNLTLITSSHFVKSKSN